MEALEFAMDNVQKDATSLKSERDDAVRKMSVCEARFDEMQVKCVYFSSTKGLITFTVCVANAIRLFDLLM